MGEDDRVALLLRHADRHQFVVEQPLRPGGGRALMAAHRIGVARLAADIIILRQILGGFDHPGADSEALDRLRHYESARQAVGDRQLARASPPADVYERAYVQAMS